MILVALNVLQFAVIIFLMLPGAGHRAELAVEAVLGEIGEQEEAELPKNATRAQRFEWHKDRAERGNADSQVHIGTSYYFGLTVQKDQQEAIRWFRLAADQGNAVAQTNLGEIYDWRGGIFVHDIAEAVKWYRKAAEQGSAVAQLGMGNCYLGGRGVPKDHVKAYMWFSISSSKEREAASRRDYLEKQLTPEQLAEAKRLASEWWQDRRKSAQK